MQQRWSQKPTITDEWLSGRLGSELLSAEQALVDDVLEGVFGEHLLQIGRWGGAPEGMIANARTQHSVTVYEAGQSGQVSADFARLPFADQSVDAVLLPHTLELAARPHDILREAHRVLRSEGHLMLLGFKPIGFWGLRRLLSRRSFPPGTERVLGERKLHDWLQLLDLRIQQHHRFFFRMPISRQWGGQRIPWEELGQRWWPELGACYWIQARKRVATLTRIRPSWKQRARVVSGIAEPSLRDALKSAPVKKLPDSQ
ncbi:MAG: class I SAM-dependent methyltransferase [Pseudomonadota bacterium]